MQACWLCYCLNDVDFQRTCLLLCRSKLCEARSSLWIVWRKRAGSNDRPDLGFVPTH
ncbi:hypothetical protein OESDEN_24086 [Oesophagostomum dentatum]|uniref:Uncharacterized protein n=1 Tax=Oesophagostomum dentatum TaxID=61180 RepID=A0A0B1RUB6_OESDE|nr:hypothetical protein OESDEN_24086 [Oesophagostomum dentatum]